MLNNWIRNCDTWIRAALAPEEKKGELLVNHKAQQRDKQDSEIEDPNDSYNC